MTRLSKYGEANSDKRLAWWLKRKTSSMTAKEALRYLDSHEYADIKSHQQLANSKLDMELLKKTNQPAKDEAAALWAELIYSGETDTRYMELCLMEKSLVPPTFTTVIYCSACGHVPHRPLEFNTVSFCDWCPTGAFIINKKDDEEADAKWTEHCNKMACYAEEAIERLKLKGEYYNDNIEC